VIREIESTTISREDPFSIEVDLGHPTYDPDGISGELSLEPGWAWRQGARLGGVTKTSSRWHGQLAEGSGSSEYEQALAQVISFLTQHEHFIAEFTSGGGEIEIVLNHAAVDVPEGIALDLQLTPVLLAHLANHNIGLRVRAWSNNPSWNAAR